MGLQSVLPAARGSCAHCRLASWVGDTAFVCFVGPFESEYTNIVVFSDHQEIAKRLQGRKFSVVRVYRTPP